MIINKLLIFLIDFFLSFHAVNTSPSLPVFQITCGAVSERSPPSCVSIKDYASQQTAASTVTVWTDTVCVMMVGRVLLVTLWCVSHQLADPMASVPPVSMKVLVKIKQNSRITYSTVILNL